MKYLLAGMIAFWLLSLYMYWAADRPGDDFGAGVLAWLLIAVSVILTILYFGLAVWNHRFL